MFNSREIASFVWLIIIFSAALIKEKKMRISLKNVFLSFTKLKILITIFFMISYLIPIIFCLKKINFWDFSLLKDTILWFIFSGFIMIFSYLDDSNKKEFFKNTVVSNFKFLILFEFIINSFNFNLIGELIFIPFVTIISIMEKISENKEEYKSVNKFFKIIIFFIGLIIIFLSFKHLILDYKEFQNLSTLKNLLLAPILTILFIPIIYILGLLIEYDGLFCRLNMGLPKKNNIKLYAKFHLFKELKINLNRIYKANNMGIYNLMKIQTKEDVKEMIRTYREKI